MAGPIQTRGSRHKSPKNSRENAGIPDDEAPPIIDNLETPVPNDSEQQFDPEHGETNPPDDITGLHKKAKAGHDSEASIMEDQMPPAEVINKPISPDTATGPSPKPPNPSDAPTDDDTEEQSELETIAQNGDVTMTPTPTIANGTAPMPNSPTSATINGPTASDLTNTALPNANQSNGAPAENTDANKPADDNEKPQPIGTHQPPNVPIATSANPEDQPRTTDSEIATAIERAAPPDSPAETAAQPQQSELTPEAIGAIAKKPILRENPPPPHAEEDTREPPTRPDPPPETGNGSSAEAAPTGTWKTTIERTKLLCTPAKEGLTQVDWNTLNNNNHGNRTVYLAQQHVLSRSS